MARRFISSQPAKFKKCVTLCYNLLQNAQKDSVAHYHRHWERGVSLKMLTEFLRRQKGRKAGVLRQVF